MKHRKSSVTIEVLFALVLLSILLLVFAWLIK